MSEFAALGLSDALCKTISDVGFTKPSEIQEKAIPAVFMMRDVVGIAQTGTGKTGSFVLPTVDILKDGRTRAKMPRTLVLAPTRELAAQVQEEFDKFAAPHGVSSVLLVGGERMNLQIKALEDGADVIVATPGRLLDMFERGNIMLNDIQMFIIDECDRMLDMGFIPDIEAITDKLPDHHQTLMFSATLDKNIETLIPKFTNRPKTIKVAPPATTAKNVEQFFAKTTTRAKQQFLLDIIAQEKSEHGITQGIIFCNRKRDIRGVTDSLRKTRMKIGTLHGDMEQSRRNEALAAFKDGELTLLVCSDVAARGIDIKDMSHVINFDTPHNGDDYVHRVGRTGRAGAKGRAITLVTDEDDKKVASIIKLIKKTPPDYTLESKQERTPPPVKTSKGTAEKGFGDHVPSFIQGQAA